MKQLILTGPDKKIELLQKELDLKLRRLGIDDELIEIKEIESFDIIEVNAADVITGPEQAAIPEQGIAPGATENNDSGSETKDGGVKTDNEEPVKPEAKEADVKTDVNKDGETEGVKTADETAKDKAEKSSVNVTGKPARTTKQDKEADNLKKK